MIRTTVASKASSDQRHQIEISSRSEPFPMKPQGRWTHLAPPEWLRHRTPFATGRLRQRGFLILAILLWIAGSISTYHIWIRGADHRDFYPWWAAARGVVEGSSDIYSPEATRSIQVRLYGFEIPEGRDQQGFVIPQF
jgi:hypothetical protein